MGPSNLFFGVLTTAATMIMTGVIAESSYINSCFDISFGMDTKNHSVRIGISAGVTAFLMMLMTGLLD